MISIHRYVSTACQHERHEGCRVVCKFCEQLCLCRCHWDGSATQHAQMVHEVEMNRRLSARIDGSESA